MASDDLNQRDARLVAWLGEAHAKEAELEADLTAHIGLTQKASYKKRLQDHLKETRDHKRQVERRIKQLGGSLDTNGSIAGVSVPGPIGAAGEVAGKTVAMLKGQLGAVRAAVTEQVETHLRNAQEELREEHVEIALYNRIEAFAKEVGDKDTARLAAGIRKQEERMAKFLDAELGRLVKELVRNEVPRDQRPTARRSTRSRGSAASRSRSSGSSASSRSASRSRTAGTAGSSSGSRGTSRSSAKTSRSSAGTSRSTAKTSRSSAGTSRSSAKTSRSTAKTTRSTAKPASSTRSASGGSRATRSS